MQKVAELQGILFGLRQLQDRRLWMGVINLEPAHLPLVPCELRHARDGSGRRRRGEQSKQHPSAAAVPLGFSIVARPRCGARAQPCQPDQAGPGGGPPDPARRATNFRVGERDANDIVGRCKRLQVGPCRREQVRTVQVAGEVEPRQRAPGLIRRLLHGRFRHERRDRDGVEIGLCLLGEERRYLVAQVPRRLGGQQSPMTGLGGRGEMTPSPAVSSPASQAARAASTSLGASLAAARLAVPVMTNSASAAAVAREVNGVSGRIGGGNIQAATNARL